MVIFTKYLGPTKNRQARIKAWTAVRRQAAYIFHDPRKSVPGNHKAAVDELCRRMNWTDQHFVSGTMPPNGYVFITCDAVGTHTHTALPPLTAMLEPHPGRSNGAAPHTAPWVKVKPSKVHEEEIEVDPDISEEEIPDGAVDTSAAQAFRAAMLKAGVMATVIDQLLKLGPDGMYTEYKAGSLRFATPAVQMAFVEALKQWYATTVTAPAQQET